MLQEKFEFAITARKLLVILLVVAVPISLVEYCVLGECTLR